MQARLKIGIMGVGMVGSAVKKYFEKEGYRPFLYDPGKNLGTLEEVNKAEVVFVCVPTPFDKAKGFDFSFVEKAVSSIKGEKIVVIKSTVVPGTTQALQSKHLSHKFLFNPEFLVEAYPDEGMQRPGRQILGITKESREIAQEIMEILPRAPYQRVMPSNEAEMVKYFGNTFLAMKVIFGVQLYKLCQKIGVDYELVREAASADKRIGPSHLDVRHGGYLGYGGKCLPKDMRAFIAFAKSQGLDLELHKKVEEINNKLMQEQGVDDPEKYSIRNPF